MSALTYAQAVVIGALQGVTELFPISSLGHSVLVLAWIGGSWTTLVTEGSSDTGTPTWRCGDLTCGHGVGPSDVLPARLGGNRWRTGGLAAHPHGTNLHAAAGVAADHRDHPAGSARAGVRASAAGAVRQTTVGGGVSHDQRDDPGRRRAAAPAGTHLRGRARQRRFHEHGRASSPSSRSAGYWPAVGIGFAQALALLAGISRAGVSMVGGLLRGLDHDDAAKFAFLLATPVI